MKEIYKSHTHHIHVAYKTVGLLSCQTSSQIRKYQTIFKEDKKNTLKAFKSHDSTKICKKHSWIKGIQVCSYESTALFKGRN